MKTLTQDAMKIKLRPPLIVIPTSANSDEASVKSAPQKLSLRLVIRTVDKFMTTLLLGTGSIRQKVAPDERSRESHEFVNTAAQYHRSTRNVF